MSTEKDTPSLDAAYALETPEDSVRLYRDWADSYDSGFVDGQDYQLHMHVAQAFRDAGGRGPIVDVGAGTGLCGAMLARMGIGPIDGVDISPEMLDEAAKKAVYRNLWVADLYAGPPGQASAYAGIVSSGTFTNGHVGPEVLPDLLTLAMPGALVCLSVNAQHYAAKGFTTMLERLDGTTIRELSVTETRIYGGQAQGDHVDDMALIVMFRLTS